MNIQRTQTVAFRICLALMVSALLSGQSAEAAGHVKKHRSNKSHRTLAKAKAKTGVKPEAVNSAATPEAVGANAAAESKVAPAASNNATVSSLSEDAIELTKPQSFVEAGVLGVTDRNWKFGQYNGLSDSGAYGIGNFDLRGGAAFDSGDATRWRLTGRNIGQENRELTGEYRDQGKYKLNFGYDEIFRFGQGSYRTPYLGVGGNDLRLPGDWEYPDLANNIRSIPSSDYNLFRGVDLKTKRRRVDGGFSYLLNPSWELKASMRHEDKNGISALGAPMISEAFGGAVILPNPISQSTDQINASLNFTGKKLFGQFAYYGSLFHNDYKSVSYDYAFAPSSPAVPAFGRMSTLPDNQFHQFNLNGGYNFSTDTKLVASGSYGRNWQNDAFLPYNTTQMSSLALLPRSSLNGDVEFKSASLKLTHRQSKDLNFAAAYKYDERDNRTQVAQYHFPDADSVLTFPDRNIRSNTPYSRRNQQGNLDMNYSFADGQWLKLGYELQNIDRWCNGTWTSCWDAGTTVENTGRIDYRGSFWKRLNTKLGYAYSHRSADHYNQDAAWAASFTSPETMAFYNQISALGIPAWGPKLGFPINGVPQPYPTLFPDNNPGTAALGSNPIDIAGLGRFNTSNRDRHYFHSMLDYQVNDKLTLGVNGSFRHEDYPQSAFGLQSSRNWSINFDGNYAFSEAFSAHVFYTYQQINSKTRGSSYDVNLNEGSPTAGSVAGGCFNNVLAMNQNAKVDPCLGWLSNTTDNIDTVGLGLKHKGFLSGKLDLTGDFFYSFARTLVDVSGGQYVLTPGGDVDAGPYSYIRAAALPEVRSQTFTFKLDAKYTINRSSAAHLTYLFQHLNSRDYIYTGMQPAGTPTSVMPTFETAPNYSVNAIGLSYVYNF